MAKIIRFGVLKRLLSMSLKPEDIDQKLMPDALVTRYCDLMLASDATPSMIARSQLPLRAFLT